MTQLTTSAPLADIRATLPGITEGLLHREQGRELPHQEIQELVDRGIGKIRLPENHGGLGLTWRQTAELLLEVASADSNIVQALRGHFTQVEDALYALNSPTATPQARVQALYTVNIARSGELIGNAWTEPGAGGTATSLTYLGEQGYSLNGTKYYTTGSIFARWADVTARNSETQEVFSVLAPLTAELDGVPTARISDDWAGFGQKTTGSGTTVFTNTPIAPDAVKPFTERIPVQNGIYELFLLIALAGVIASASNQATGILRERTRNYSHANSDLPRHDPQNLQVLGEIEAASFTAHALVLSCAEALDQTLEALSQENQETITNAIYAFENTVAKAQIVLSKLVPESTTRIFDALSASATDTTHTLDRHWRNARTLASHNPWIYRARQLGDLAVNGVLPQLEWTIGINKGNGND